MCSSITPSLHELLEDANGVLPMSPHEDQRCLICYDQFNITDAKHANAPLRLPCSGQHVACRSCIQEWVSHCSNKGKTSTCGVCREVICSNDFGKHFTYVRRYVSSVNDSHAYYELHDIWRFEQSPAERSDAQDQDQIEAIIENEDVGENWQRYRHALINTRPASSYVFSNEAHLISEYEFEQIGNASPVEIAEHFKQSCITGFWCSCGCHEGSDLDTSNNLSELSATEVEDLFYTVVGNLSDGILRAYGSPLVDSSGEHVRIAGSVSA